MAQDLSLNYQKLMQSIEQLPQEEQTDELVARILIIDRLIKEANIAVENLHFEVLGKKVTLNEIELQEYNDMVTANQVIKEFSPYIIWYNIHKNLCKEINGQRKE